MARVEVLIIFKSITLHSFESVIGLSMLSKGMEKNILSES